MEQKSGDNSLNLQVGRDANFGVSATEVRQIAIDVFKANFYDFSEKAAKKALERAEEITDEFIKKFYIEIPKFEEKLEDPAIQNALFNTQKEFAKTGDQELKDNLIEILLKRISSEEKSLTQIVLDEAIIVLPKLTNDQINLLTLIFSSLLLNHYQINNIESFKNLINNKILVFLPTNPLSYSFFTHLQFSGCCTLLSGGTYKSFVEIISHRYKGLLTKGFLETDLTNEFPEGTIGLHPIITRCQQNISKIQFNALNDDILKQSISENNLSMLESRIINFQNKFIMNPIEIEEYLRTINPNFEKLMEIWSNDDFKSIKLTSVGLAIAIINYNRITGNNIRIDDFL